MGGAPVPGFLRHQYLRTVGSRLPKESGIILRLLEAFLVRVVEALKRELFDASRQL